MNKQNEEIEAGVEAGSVEKVSEAIEAPSAVDPILQVIGDLQAKKMGVARSGGDWYKNHQTGTFYRVEKAGEGYKLMETKESAVSSIGDKKQVESHKIAEKAVGEHKEPVTKVPKEGSRADLLRQAKSRQVKCADILNKEELVLLLRTRNPLNWKEVIIKAKARRKLTDDLTK